MRPVEASQRHVTLGS